MPPPDTTPAGRATSPPPAAALRCVLIVEDDPIDAAILEDVLQPTGWRLAFEQDLEVARDRLEAEPVDLVISDLLLPRSLPDQSLALLEQIAHRWPVVVVSGWSTNLLAYLLQGGRTLAFFDKNRFDADTFRAVASAVIGRAPLRRRNPFERRAEMVPLGTAATAS